MNESRTAAPMTLATTSVIAILALAGCTSAEPVAASPSPSDSPTPTPSPTATYPDRPATRVDGAQVRVTVAVDDTLEVLDLNELELSSLTTIDLAGPVRLTVGPDGRHVYASNADAGLTSVLDAGSYAQSHGDHDDFYVREPGLRPDVIEGDQPAHIVGHDGRVAIFHDGSGDVAVFDEIGLSAGGLQVETVATGAAHHGVAVPLEDGLLVSVDSGDELPATLHQLDLDGTVVAEYPDVCEGLHGTAVVGEIVAFGCAHHVAVIDTHDQSSSTIGYPDDHGDARVGSLQAGNSLLLGSWDANHLVVIDPEHGEMDIMEVHGDIAATAVGADNEVLVLTTDGTVHVLDDHGHEIGEVDALDSVTLPDGHAGARPVLAVAGHTLVISDVDGQQLVVIDLDALSVAGTFALSGTPTAVVVTGQDPDASGDHDDHDHEDDDHGHDEDDHGHDDEDDHDHEDGDH